MLVVADTTPLHYLILIDTVNVLPALFERVCIPDIVVEEMSRESAPGAVRSWIATPPPWLEIRTVEDKAGKLPPALSSLDPGESAALALALALRPDFLLIDERRGTQIALDLGLRPTGTLGVLDMAAARKLVDFATIIERLRSTNFRYPRSLVERLLAEDAKRDQGRA